MICCCVRIFNQSEPPRRWTGPLLTNQIWTSYSSITMHQRNYPGSASLFHDLGKKMMVYLHGGRVYFGFLRIIDQFGNVVLHQAFERIHVDKKFCDIPQGILMIRGENIILIGEVYPVIFICGPIEVLLVMELVSVTLLILVIGNARLSCVCERL
ncbi:hypothetical protein CRM22_009891 [Opisthorchis felineus]|uniref:U6 snRNA-associated Sm-like protein LSm1 n=1 Tax=Opisthorchis felineus TaxID=147828 RepID=A0A4S2L4N0_OPIFE|nr:hypothetical protein CRM22_009891 [Opisthorchis felineus]